MLGTTFIQNNAVLTLSNVFRSVVAYALFQSSYLGMADAQNSAATALYECRLKILAYSRSWHSVDGACSEWLHFHIRTLEFGFHSVAQDFQQNVVLWLEQVLLRCGTEPGRAVLHCRDSSVGR